MVAAYNAWPCLTLSKSDEVRAGRECKPAGGAVGVKDQFSKFDGNFNFPSFHLAPACELVVTKVGCRPAATLLLITSYHQIF